MEYTLTITLPKNTDDYASFYYEWRYQCTNNYASFAANTNSINDFLDSIETQLIPSLLIDGLTYTIVDDNTQWIVTIVLTVTTQCIPLNLHINIFEGEQFISANFTSEAPTPCNECQTVTLANCSDPDLSLPISDGSYTVSIKDHTSGNIYTQAIEVTNGGIDWDNSSTVGVFTPYSVFTVTLADENGDPVSWTSGTSIYNCVRMTFANTINTTPEG